MTNIIYRVYIKIGNKLLGPDPDEVSVTVLIKKSKKVLKNINSKTTLKHSKKLTFSDGLR